MPAQAGEKYGRLTPLYVIGRTSNRVKIWHCKCDCGNFKDAVKAREETEKIYHKEYHYDDIGVEIYGRTN